MSVVAFNETMNMTLSSQHFFDKYWKVAIEEMNLPLLAPLMYNLHVEVSGENWQQLEQELQILQQWASERVAQPQGGFIISRAQQLLEVLPQVFANPDARLVIAP